MFDDEKRNIKKIDYLIDEYRYYKISKDNFSKKASKLYKQFKEGTISYEEYERLLEKETKNKTRSEFFSYHNHYLDYTVKRMMYANAEIFYNFYKEHPKVKKRGKTDKILKHLSEDIARGEKAIKDSYEHFAESAIEKEKKGILGIKNLKKRIEGLFSRKGTAGKKRNEDYGTSSSGYLKNIKEAKPVIAEPRKKSMPFDKEMLVYDKKKIFDEKKEIKKELAEKKRFPWFRLDFRKVFSFKFHKKDSENLKEPLKKSDLINKEQLLREKEKDIEEKIDKKYEKQETKEFRDFFSEIIKRKKEESPIVAPGKTIQVRKKGVFERIGIFLGLKREKKSVIDQIISEKQSDKEDAIKVKKESTEFRFGGIGHSLKKLFGVKKKEIFSEKTKIEPTLMGLKKAETYEGSKEHLDESIMLEEARKIRKLLKEEEKFKAYEPSSVGALANVSVKKMSFFLLEEFPDFFREFHLSLRRANIPVLSNTYVNIMVFCSILAFALGTFFHGLVKSILGIPFIVFIFNSLLFGLLMGAVVAFGFYYYPKMRAQSRRKSINSNLPFAVSHMAAITSSGIPPLVMFRLLAESEEYEEVSVELNKVVLFADVFGYDLLSAIKSVSETTPSPAIKEFFEGMILSIETGSDLTHYLNQKANESMATYQLERQKYAESVSTYSDIYTGILIAAPLFFVSTLSLVSLLGGTIGGMGVNTLITYGTYLVIPALNILFIIFLQMSQPEI